MILWLRSPRQIYTYTLIYLRQETLWLQIRSDKLVPSGDCGFWFIGRVHDQAIVIEISQEEEFFASYFGIDQIMQ